MLLFPRDNRQKTGVKHSYSFGFIISCKDTVIILILISLVVFFNEIYSYQLFQRMKVYHSPGEVNHFLLCHLV